MPPLVPAQLLLVVKTGPGFSLNVVRVVISLDGEPHGMLGDIRPIGWGITVRYAQESVPKRVIAGSSLRF